MVSRLAAFVFGLLIVVPAAAHRGNIAYGGHDTGVETGHYVDGLYATGKHLNRLDWETSCSADNGTACNYQNSVRDDGWLYKRSFTWLFPKVQHCDLGDTLQGGVCAPSTSCQLPDYVYTTDTNPVPNFGNADDCLWELYSQTNNQDGTVNVTYKATGWAWADGDDFTGSNDSTPGNPIGDLPAAASGYDDPFGGGGGGPVACAIGTESFAQWVYDDPSDPDRSTHCLSNGCEAINWAHDGTGGAVNGICLGDGTEADDACFSEVVYTGETCTHGNDPNVDTDSDNTATGGSGSANNAGVESRLDEVVDALTCDPLDADCGSPDVPNDAVDYGTTAQTVYDRIEAAPIVAALGNIGTSIPAGACPTASTDPIEVLGDAILTLDAHCTIWQEFDDVLHGFMLIVWSLIGVGIVFRA